ncbi:seven-hairpin glycosidase [Russula earlei]|uniref:Seven-hairpin glycosidase n=1 Tax=Russula earlei TaxID=71964 RepID=A0ACC0U399_9AGAM|nr:seven-hairpin glycosidase [Russula earlei]
MSPLLQLQPFTRFIPRPHVRLILFILVFGSFCVVFLPPTFTPHLMDRPAHHPPHMPPHRFPLPQSGSHRHRINSQHSSTEHDHRRKGDVWARRADAVRDAFLHAYNGYLAHAAPHDELRPLSKSPIDNFNGWSLSYIESLDTLWLMGLYEEFDSALAVVANVSFTLPPNRYAPFFETVIRYLGGLLSAYALSQDPILLTRADDLGTALLPVFGTPSGLPTFSVNTVSGKVATGWIGPAALWSEALTCQLEFKYLAHLTGRTKYYTAVEKAMDVMYKANLSSSSDLFPTMWSTETGLPTSTSVSVGAFADSAYEYMLKQWLLSGGKDTKARDLYLRSANAILDRLTYITPTRNLLYVTDASVNSSGELSPTHVFEHLTCFLPGVLALGAATLPDVPRTHLWAAKGLAHTCWILYADSPIGLSPDEVIMHPESADEPRWDGLWAKQPRAPVDNEKAREYTPNKSAYLLRPETVESFYLLWRTTGDVMWRERGWTVFKALVNATRVEDGGFASIGNAYLVGSPKLDQMPSWFLAETLKYLFLLFTDDDLVPLDQWVFNTEAHPLPVLQWSEWELERYGISHSFRVEEL